MSNISSIINNYIILQRLEQYFGLHHLYCCVLVSKEWNSNFIPILWRNIDLSWNFNSTVLSNHQQHIVSLASLHILPRHTKDNLVSTCFPKLQYIIEGRGSAQSQPVDSSYLTRVINSQPQTTALKTISIAITNDIPQNLTHVLPASLSSLSCLRIIDLHIKPKCSFHALQSIIYSCHQCTTFRLKMCLDQQTISPDQIKDFITSISELPVFRFEDLSIQLLNLGQDLGIMVPLLQHSPNVNVFDLYLPYSLNTLQRITEILQNYQLKCFGIEGDPKKIHDTTCWTIVQTLLQKVNGMSRNVQPLTLHINAPIYNHGTTDDSRIFFQNTLPRFFSNNLTSLDLPKIGIDKFILLLGQLSALQSVTASLYPSKRDFNLVELSNVQWPCIGIKKLNIMFPASCFIQYSDHRIATILLKNIGKLTALQEWTLRSQRISTEPIITVQNSRGNFLRGGHLKDLVDLKQLYKLDLSGGNLIRSNIRLNNIMWMINHWTGLRHIVFPKPALSEGEVRKLLDLAMEKDIYIEIVK